MTIPLTMNHKPIIGVIGGMGPYAGLDLTRKIFDNTIASRDQEHLPLMLVSSPEEIEDRTLFLTGQSDRNPAESIFSIISTLERGGATVAGIPCNTAHAPRIFDQLATRIKEAGYRIRLLHMISEVGQLIRSSHNHLKSIGLLSTLGTYRARIYQKILEPLGLTVIIPDEDHQESLVHDAIYNPTYGIKAKSNPVPANARTLLLQGISHLRARGADAVILGCTEIPLAIPETRIEDMILIDPAFVLARALIRETYPEKLRPLH